MKGKDRTIELPGYLILSFEELIPLLVCVAFDLTEYFAMFLLAPLIGDFLDIVGVGICLYLFGWTGLISLIELLPGFDIIPIFVITWILWFYLKKDRERQEIERMFK